MSELQVMDCGPGSRGCGRRRAGPICGPQTFCQAGSSPGSPGQQVVGQVQLQSRQGPVSPMAASWGSLLSLLSFPSLKEDSICNQLKGSAATEIHSRVEYKEADNSRHFSFLSGLQSPVSPDPCLPSHAFALCLALYGLLIPN